ncbi:MAG: peptide chain release factor-like protein [bacterium]
MAKIILPESNDKLLEECDVMTFRSGGPGGQHVNKTESGVRLVHRLTGIAVTCRQERSQIRNRDICLERLRERIEKLSYRPPRRIPTKTPARAKAKRLESKTKQSLKKKLRAKPVAEE